MSKTLFILSALASTLAFAESPRPEASAPLQVSQTRGELNDPTQKPGAPANTVPPEGGALVIKTSPDYFPGGCGFRKALGGLVKVYEICFLGKNMKASEWSNTWNSPLGSKSFKLKLNFLRGVGGKNVSAAFSEGLSKTPAAQKLEEMERQKFLAWAAKLKIEKASVMEFVFNEDKPMKVNFFESPDAVTPAVFASEQQGLAKATAAIWYGERPLNGELKNDLLK